MWIAASRRGHHARIANAASGPVAGLSHSVYPQMPARTDAARAEFVSTRPDTLRKCPIRNSSHLSNKLYRRRKCVTGNTASREIPGTSRSLGSIVVHPGFQLRQGDLAERQPGSLPAVTLPISGRCAAVPPDCQHSVPVWPHTQAVKAAVPDLAPPRPPPRSPRPPHVGTAIRRA